MAVGLVVNLELWERWAPGGWAPRRRSTHRSQEFCEKVGLVPLALSVKTQAGLEVEWGFCSLAFRLTYKDRVWFSGGIGYFLLCPGSEPPELLVLSRFLHN